MATVLLCSGNLVLSDLLTRNLARRGYQVRQVRWDPCMGDRADVPRAGGAAVVVVDLGCAEPECWRAAARVRPLFDALPVLFLSYGWPGAERLRAWQPARHLHKPVAVDDLLHVLRDLMARPHRREA